MQVSRNGVIQKKDEVLAKWGKTEFVKSTSTIEAKGWLLDVLMCVERIKKKEFSLEDVYIFEGHLKGKHPSNNNVQAKTQSGQQLQFLREMNNTKTLGLFSPVFFSLMGFVTHFNIGILMP